MAPSARSRRLRWVAPFATAAVIALIVAVPGLSAAGTPSLPVLSPAQLLAKVQQANVDHLSGTIKMSTNLGIPNLSVLANAAGGGGHGPAGFSPTDLLSGSHEAGVWLAGPDQARVALLQDMAETDLIHNGADTWLWDSTTKQVTHWTKAATSHAGGSDATATAPEPIKTPQQMADELLSQVTPSTSVSVAAPVKVAGQKAYQLVLAPHSVASTVDHVVIAVDSVTSLPLDVQIFAKGQKAAAVKLGFSKINYATPAASRFSFTPPPGSTLTGPGGASAHTKSGSQRIPAPEVTAPTADKSVTVGQDWNSVAIFSNVQLPSQLNEVLQAATTVSTPAGPGRLLSTALVNVLVLNDGRIAVGAVNASTLEAAIAASH